MKSVQITHLGLLDSAVSPAVALSHTQWIHASHLLVFTMPDQLPIPEDLLHPVQWNTVQLTLTVMEAESKMIIRLEENRAQWHTNNAVLKPVIVANLDIGLSELLVPANAAEQFVDRDHLTQLPWLRNRQSGHGQSW
jgi:hypothetical protein